MIAHYVYQFFPYLRGPLLQPILLWLGFIKDIQTDREENGNKSEENHYLSTSHLEFCNE